MALRLKRIEDQTIVITGATSGIGLATARLAARRGARLMLAARNREALQQLTDQINQKQGDAGFVMADVGHEQEVRSIARAAIERFGAFDTWINNAGASIFGRMLDVSTADHRKLFETNFWGIVYGSLEAARHFRRRRGRYAGAIINLGSVLSDRAIPIQGMYSASKHAVKGFTEALRMELEEAGAPVSVSLVKPSSTDTPFPQHARNYMDREPTLPPPVYSPDLVARNILHCAQTPEREVTVGAGGKAIAVAGHYAPRLSDKLMEALFFRAQKTDQPPRNPAGALHAPTLGLRQRGEAAGPVLSSSAYTAMSLHPALTALVAVGAGLAIASLLSGEAAADRPRN